MSEAEDVYEALALLRQARALLVRANSPKAAARVRLAISSAKGAMRNACNRAVRSLRSSVKEGRRST